MRRRARLLRRGARLASARRGGTPATGGPVYYTAQTTGKLGILDPATRKYEEIPLGRNSAPHGVVVGPDGAPWITDGGQNAIVRVDPATKAVRVFPLPADTEYANLNTLTFDAKGRVWFTGQTGYYGRLVPATGDMKVWKAPRGRGPYGITTTPRGEVYYASLAGSHIARIDTETGEATVIEPPTPRQGARRVWSDSRGRIWVSYWNTGQLGMYDPAANTWREWTLPATRRARTLSGSIPPTRCGSPSGRRTRSSASTRSRRSSRRFRRIDPGPTCGRCLDARASSGAPNRATSGS